MQRKRHCIYALIFACEWAWPPAKLFELGSNVRLEIIVNLPFTVYFEIRSVVSSKNTTLTGKRARRFVLFSKWTRNERHQIFKNFKQNLDTNVQKKADQRNDFNLVKLHFVRKRASLGDCDVMQPYESNCQSDQADQEYINVVTDDCQYYLDKHLKFIVCRLIQFESISRDMTFLTELFYILLGCKHKLTVKLQKLYTLK